MKREMVTIWFLALVVILCSPNVSEAAPMGTAFTYQGFLYDANSPADDIYDFKFTLYDANDAGSPVGSPVAKEDVDVFAGSFTVELDFGSDPFDGDARWLEIGVRPGDSIVSFTTLSPRQELTPTPYAVYAENSTGLLSVDGVANAGGDVDLIQGDSIIITPDDGANTITIEETHSPRTDNPHVVTSAQTGALVSVDGVSNAGGNVDFVAGANMTITPNDGSNTITFSASGGGAGDGHSLDAADGSPTDVVYVDNDGEVGIGTTSPAAKLTVNGAILRSGSTMYGSNADTHINLGTSSTTGTNGLHYSYATVGGGYYNNARYDYATVGGGKENTATDDYATVGGGYLNTASGFYATVPGGTNNSAGGDYSFAAGRRAKSDSIGTFTWADSTNSDFPNSTNNCFAVRASGSVRFYSSSDLSTGVFLAAGSGSWASVSDRDAKENFATVDTRDILEKLVDVPIATWQYKPETDSVRHIGPMAQDLYAALGFGDSDKTITTIDADGISFAAIQGLYEIVQEKDAEIAAMKEHLAKMEAAISQLINSNEGGKL